MWEDWADELQVAFFVSTHGEGIDDAELQESFYDGWINSDNTPDDRHAAREEFFDWMEENGYDIEEFDWDDWRDWYESA